MVIYVNKATIVGNVGSDPEARGREGLPVSFSVATTERWKDRDGNQQERTQWHRIVIFNKGAADFATRYIKKGDVVYVEGQMETRSWTKDDGTEVQLHEIVVKPFSGVLQSMSRGDRSEPREERRESAREDRGLSDRGHRQQEASTGFRDDIDDDIPF